MSTVNYSIYSMYFTTPLNPAGQFLDIWQPRNIGATKNDKTITINSTYNQRPDLLSFDLYGDARLWWVFAQRNPNILGSDPLGNFVSGTEIIVPSASNLKTALGIS